MEEIDYRELLKKYMQHVIDCEGAHFLYDINEPVSDVDFTTDEVRELLKIKDEIE